MAEESIERRLVGGEWQTVRRRDSGGGSVPAGGSTGEVLTKESNADGDVGWEPSGGSGPVELVTVEYAFDDGFKTLAELGAGDVILMAVADVTVAFNGDTPVLYCTDDPENLDVFFLSVFDVATGRVIQEGLSVPGNALAVPWTLSGKLGTDADPSVDPAGTTGVATVTIAILRMTA